MINIDQIDAFAFSAPIVCALASQYIPLVMLWDSLESIASCEHHRNILRSIISNNKSLLFIFLICSS